MAIYPKEILDFTYEVVHKKHKTKSSVIYKSALITLLSAIISLPFIYIEININSRGLINSDIDNYNIKSEITGSIKEMIFKENEKVNKGDTLIIIDNSELIEKKLLLQQNLESKKIYLEDLKHLLNGDYHLLSSSKYKEELELIDDELALLNIKLNRSLRSYKRQLKLYRSKVISESEYEKSKYKLDLTKADIVKFNSNNLKQWTREYDAYEQEKNISQIEINRIEKEIDKSIITSPISGHINNYKTLEDQSVIFANQKIAEISPSENLIAEIYISPNDIGLLQENTNVKLQIDAYNYNQWGFVEAKLVTLSKDVYLINNTPVFKATCKLLDDKLFLQNGFEGKLKKGMSLSARIKVAERSLYNLLYDKVDDWINPNKKRV